MVIVADVSFVLQKNRGDKIMNRLLLCAVGSSFLVGCAGKIDYVRPDRPATVANTKVIELHRDQVWNAAVPELGKRFFVINNLDKSSGLVNVSYSGDPEQYINCGVISSYVSNARGERTHRFPAATASKQYEVMHNGQLFFLNRKMELEGRVNLVFEEMSSNQTRVTANTRYVVKKTVTGNNAQGQMIPPQSDTIAFNTGKSASFSSNDGRATTECVSTGRLEADILDAIR